MKAIIETGGKQYSVEEGTELYVELLDVEPTKEVVFDKIVMVDGIFGNPYVENVKVIGEVIKVKALYNEESLLKWLNKLVEYLPSNFGKIPIIFHNDSLFS